MKVFRFYFSLIFNIIYIVNNDYCKVENKDNGDGSCSVVYTPEAEGDYLVFVKYNDVDIPDSPFKVKFTGSLKLSDIQILKV